MKEPAVWDALGAQGMRSRPDRRAAVVPAAQGVPRLARRLLPDAAVGRALGVPAGARGRDRGGARREGRSTSSTSRTSARRASTSTLDQVFKMTERRFQVGRRLIQNKPWDFFMLCDIAPDRLHHVFWQYYDPRHPLYEPGNQYETVFQDYYRFLDRQLARLLELVPEDAVTIVMSRPRRASDDGRPVLQRLADPGGVPRARASRSPTGPIPIKEAAIDWSRTIAWGDGGYYGRLFLNVKGREPQGMVEPADYEATRDELIAKLEAAPGPDGQPLGTKVLKPQDVYPEVRGVAPDLIVYFGDLEWRSVGSVGNPSLYTYENDTGPDGANHDRDGVFIMKGLPGQPTGKVDGLQPRRRRPHRSWPSTASTRPRRCRRRRKELPVHERPEGLHRVVHRAVRSGKSTIAEMLFHEFQARGMKTEILDGDVVRQNLSKGLGFSKEDRDTNIMRIGFVANLLTRNGVAAICCPISPYKETRDACRELIGEFVEVYVHATVEEIAANRDPKGLYKKALAGEIKGFTGVDAPYEVPEHPELMRRHAGRDARGVAAARRSTTLASSGTSRTARSCRGRPGALGHDRPPGDRSRATSPRAASECCSRGPATRRPRLRRQLAIPGRPRARRVGPPVPCGSGPARRFLRRSTMASHPSPAAEGSRVVVPPDVVGEQLDARVDHHRVPGRDELEPRRPRLGHEYARPRRDGADDAAREGLRREGEQAVGHRRGVRRARERRSGTTAGTPRPRPPDRRRSPC